MTDSLLLHLAVAAGLGLLIGLQRERQEQPAQGIRTFPLVALFGVLCGWLARTLGSWIVLGGVLAVAALVVTANVLRLRAGAPEDADPGMTTEIALLVTFGVGAILPFGALVEGIVVGAATALLLHWKEPLHDFADRLGSDDFAAIMRLTLLALVILPVLPNQAYGPYGVLNPFEIWLVVVLIVGISMGGYVAYRLFGEKQGALTAGLLGGIISSTATTVSYARRSANAPDRSRAAAVVITLASTVVFVRVMVEMALVSPSALAASWQPITAMLGIMIVISAVLYWLGVGEESTEVQDHEPPSNLVAALTFGLLYGLVLLGVAWGHERFGEGVYLVGIISGLTDVDAITLSTAHLMESGDMDPGRGWRMILVGALSNTFFKGVIAAVMGSRVLKIRVAVAFAAALAAGGALLALWPG